MFAVLASAIIAQQVSNKAAEALQRRVEALAGGSLTPEALAALSPELLRGAGLSYAKGRWLVDLGQRVASGALDLEALGELPDEAALAALDALPGVGRWTAEMVLIFGFGRLDVFSMGDLGLRNAIAALYNEGRKLDEATLRVITVRWAPWRSAASWYLWRLTDAEDSVWA